MSLPDSPTLTALLAAATPGEADRGLLALARPLAEEVIRLRAELDEARSEVEAFKGGQAVYCLGCGEVSVCDEDYCCVTCGRDLLTLANHDGVDLLDEWEADWNRSLNGIKSERDEARKEAAELRARIDLALKILDDPADESDAIYRANEALQGEK